MNKYHYTYLIEAIEPTDSRKYYIGVRSSNKWPTEDKNYIGSSKYLKEWVKINGKDKVKKTILAIWPNRELAIEHEIKMHDHFNVHLNEEFFNKSKQLVSGFDTTDTPGPWRYKSIPIENRKKISLAKKGKPSPKKNTTISEEQKRKISDSKRKNPHVFTQASIEKMKIRRTCPHCLKEGRGSAMFRYHFDNCKNKVV